MIPTPDSIAMAPINIPIVDNRRELILMRARKKIIRPIHTFATPAGNRRKSTENRLRIASIQPIPPQAIPTIENILRVSDSRVGVDERFRAGGCCMGICFLCSGMIVGGRESDGTNTVGGKGKDGGA